MRNRHQLAPDLLLERRSRAQIQLAGETRQLARKIQLELFYHICKPLEIFYGGGDRRAIQEVNELRLVANIQRDPAQSLGGAGDSRQTQRSGKHGVINGVCLQGF